MDAVLVTLDGVWKANKTLGGLVDFMEPGAPVIDEDAELGATTQKAVLIPLRVEYESTSPLG